MAEPDPREAPRGLIVIDTATDTIARADDRACAWIGRSRAALEGARASALIEILPASAPRRKALSGAATPVRILLRERHHTLDGRQTTLGAVVLLDLLAPVLRTSMPSGSTPTASSSLEVPLPLLLGDATGRIIGATGRARALLNASTEALLDDRWTGRIHAADRPEAVRALQRALREGGATRIEFRAADDPSRWFEVQAVPSLEGTDRPCWYYLLAEITLQVRAESQRAALEARLHAALASMTDATSIVEAVRDASNAIIDFRWIAANERARLHVAEQAGRDLEWLDGHRFSDVFAAESAAQERDILIPLVEGQEAAVFTGFAAHGGASIRHSFTATPVLDGLCLVHHVETDDEARERRLVASEERLRLALDGSRDAVWDWDIDSDRVFLEMPDSASEQYPLLAGSRHQTRDEAFRVVHPDDVAGFRARMQAHLDGQADVFEMVHRVQHADNAVHWRLSRGRTVARDGRGRPVRVVGTSIDITQRRASEEELERAKEAAEAANRTKGEFLANVSHELRTPLNTIIGLLEIVLDEPLPPTARSHVNDALTAAESLLRIIRDLLDFSAMEAGRFTVIEKPFDLTLAVDALVRSMNYDSAARGVTLAATIDDEVPRRIVGDPNRLRQVLTNLVGNALKFTENGRVDVTFALDASATHDAPGRVRVDVTDTGPGIEPDKLERIFAPFEQADTSTTRRFGGTGLGLAIVRRLVERMGGEVNVLSEPGRGSTFRFTFAFHAVDEEPSSSSVLRVLLVSGDVRRRQALRDALECESVQVTAIRPEDLVGAGRSSRPRDVLLWDVALLEPEGIVRGVVEACAAALRDLAPAPDRVLLLGDPSAATVRGAEAIVPRDLPAARLAERLRETTRRRDEVAEAPIGALTVLVAEDSPVNQHVIRQILQKLGHEVVTVDDGRAAVEACAARRWDLVLMDVQMPELDGFEATQRIRERERETNESPVPILALTADARESTRELCLRSGMDGWLTKPIRRADLARAIDPIGARRLVGTDEVC